MNEEKRTKYNKLIGRIGDEYYFLDYTFKYSKNFKGATGTILTPVTQEEVDERWEVENMKEQWQMAVESGSTEDDLKDWVEWVKDTDGEESILDTSGSNLYDQLRELGISENEYPFFHCTGGGRCFNKDLVWDELYNKDLWSEILKFED